MAIIQEGERLCKRNVGKMPAVYMAVEIRDSDKEQPLCMTDLLGGLSLRDLWYNSPKCLKEVAPKQIQLRTLIPEEEAEVRRLATSRKAAVRLVQRAKILVAMLDDSSLNASAASMRAGYKSEVMGPMWVKRFNKVVR